MRAVLQALQRAILAGLSIVLALLVLFEEWGWEPLARALGRLARWPPLARIEASIARLPPLGALAVFCVPALALVPVKLAALWLIGAGRPWLGVLVIVAAKLVGTALVARLFQLTRPALMRLHWFARWHARWSAFKERIVGRVRASAAWQLGRRLKAGLRRWLRRRR